MADIFISYSRKDLPTAEKLAQALIACGWSVWWDRHIPAGRRFDEVIAEQLSSAGCVLALWSRNGTRSQWVMEEAETARTNGVLVPVMIEAVEPPMGFRRIHAADLIGWGGAISHAGFKQLLIDITNRIGRPQRHHATAGLQLFPESAAAETEGVAAANDGAAGLISAVSASSAVETTWDAGAIAAIESHLTHLIGPVAKVVVSRAIQDATDLESLSTAVARSIPLDADRRQFLIRTNDLWHPKPPSKVNGGGNATTPSFGSARGYADLLTPDANLGLIEQTLTRHIGPIASVVLKRAMTRSPTRDDLCEYLATHIEREDERQQFLATVIRWV